MYATLLYMHSWFRWIVLIAGGIALVRAVTALKSKRAWAPEDRRFQLAYVSALDLQFVLGVILYVVSPITAFATLKDSMKVSALRFFNVEHVFMMVAAVAVAHVLAVRSKKAADDVRKLQLWSMGALLSFGLVLVSIPWPGFSWARPLFRL